jgi:hypothetical protein
MGWIQHKKETCIPTAAYNIHPPVWTVDGTQIKIVFSKNHETDNLWLGHSMQVYSHANNEWTFPTSVFDFLQRYFLDEHHMYHTIMLTTEAKFGNNMMIQLHPNHQGEGEWNDCLFVKGGIISLHSQALAFDCDDSSDNLEREFIPPIWRKNSLYPCMVVLFLFGMNGDTAEDKDDATLPTEKFTVLRVTSSKPTNFQNSYSSVLFDSFEVPYAQNGNPIYIAVSTKYLGEHIWVGKDFPDWFDMVVQFKGQLNLLLDPPNFPD